ncbi:MAG: glycosyltransferase [Candidatus Paceibacterota bacterium]
MSRIGILVIGNDKDLFTSYSVSARRQVAYAGSEFEQHIVVFSHAKLKHQKTRISDSLVVYPTNARTPFTHLLKAFLISRRILKEQKEKEWVISTQDPFEAGVLGLLLSRLYRVPLQVQEHGDFFSTQDWKCESLLNRVRYFLGTLVIPRANQVRVVSKRIEGTVKTMGVPAEKIVRFPVVTHIDDFKNTTPKTTLSEQTGLSGPFILWVGRMVKQKNLPLLLKAFVEVRKKIPEARLVLVGSGNEKENISRCAKELGVSEYVVMHAWSDDVASLYKTADVYALSSNYEGWARVVVEALASGLSVVMTDVGCAGEVVTDRENGRVVPRHDAEALAEALVETLSDSEARRKYGVGGREALARTETFEQAVLKTRDAWKSVRAEMS